MQNDPRSIGKQHSRSTVPSPATQIATAEVDSQPKASTSKVLGNTGTKRLLDLVLATSIGVLSLPLTLLTAVLVRFTSRGPVVYRSDRVGKNNTLFTMYKFRTMVVETPEVATHLMNEPQSFLTPVGAFLRKTSLDELPQLANVIRGEMSLVGPRPALHNQHDLIELRTKLGIHALQPGVTGLAQISGRDSLTIQEKVDLEQQYLEMRSLTIDIRLLARTVVGLFKTSHVSH